MTRLARPSAALAAVLAALALPASASSAVRWAAPNSFKASGGCAEATPCTLEWAIEAASDGDEVVVKPGTYTVTQPLSAQTHLSIHGIAGQPRPRIVGAEDANGYTLNVGYPTGPTTLRHLSIEAERDGFVALYVYGQTELTDSVAVARGTSGTAIATNGSANVLIRDTVARSTKGGTAVYARGKVDLRNVTAIGQGTNSVALRAYGECAPNALCDIKSPANVTAVNTIARATTHDVHVSSSYSQAPAVVDLSHSNWRPEKSTTAGNAASLNDLGNNQADPPAFRLALWGDFHQASTSPTIDKGTTTPLNGPTDFDGQPRLGGAAVDIGADEYHTQSSGGGEMPSGDDPAAGQPPADPGVEDPGTGPAPPADTTAPALTALRAKPRRFRATRSGASAAATRGTKVTYTLDEPATLTFFVQRATAGRLAAGRCAKPSRSNAKGRRCTRWRTLRGSFAHGGAAGANSFRFTGRLNGRALSPSRHRLVGTPSDGAGNAGKAALAGFEIAR